MFRWFLPEYFGYFYLFIYYMHSSTNINNQQSEVQLPSPSPAHLPSISRSPSWFPATGLARPPGKALPSICFYRQVILEPSILVGRGLAHVRIRHSGIRSCCCAIVDAFMFASAGDVYGGWWSLCSRAIWGHGGLAGVFIPPRRGYVRLLRAIKRRYMIRFMRGTIRKRRLYLWAVKNAVSFSSFLASGLSYSFRCFIAQTLIYCYSLCYHLFMY